MAKQRYVNTHFWDDKFIIELEPLERLLFLYCLTNPLTNILGAYEISLRRIAFDTGLDNDMVVRTFQRFEVAGKMYYRNGWLVITNFIKHQSLNPKIVSGIRNELANIPKELVELVNFEYEPKTKTMRKKVPISIRRQVFERDNNICQFCQSTEDLEIDHITPVILGGDNSLENLRTLCRICNGKRNAELRWTINGEVESKNSLPTEIGGLSHLNSNLNLNLNSNSNSNAETPKRAGTPSANLPQVKFDAQTANFLTAVRNIYGTNLLSREDRWVSAIENAITAEISEAEFTAELKKLLDDTSRKFPVTPDNVLTAAIEARAKRKNNLPVPSVPKKYASRNAEMEARGFPKMESADA